MENNVPIPDFLSISAEASQAAMDANRNEMPVDIPEFATQTEWGPTWEAPVTIERVNRTATRQGKLRLGIMIRFRPSPAGNEGVVKWVNFMNNPKPGEAYGFFFLKQLTSLLYATGKFPPDGNLDGRYLNQHFPEKGAVGVRSPLEGESLLMTVRWAPDNGKFPAHLEFESARPEKK